MYTGTGWAGDMATRKSTVGVVARVGRQLQEGWPELDANFLGRCEGLGAATLCEEWGMQSGVESLCDSVADRGIASQVGSGELKHLRAKPL